MRSPIELGPLLSRCQAEQRRCDSELAQLAREDGQLEARQRDLDGQGEGLRRLLLAQRPAGAALDRGQLFALLRKQAVLRRQLQNLDLQREQAREQRLQLAERRERQAALRRQWLRKEEKYQRWMQLQRRRRRLLGLRQEEIEQEEMTTWQA
ncbi:hypothetical protein KIF53_13045 [Chromobacterium subtsugae]|uniref:Type III secretion system protein SpaM n=1 Tax=Chromobacterium subtsugae TaxID=251747 RepID=A0ABS7FFK3_9NEIS|nr:MULTISPECIES: hypothetical protein [Chromobacterium]KZE88092.1 hypothetical protein AWB61_07060 [Chromobacterium sp. F49]MBW7565739.1 hypothetical protein [Chromobacterium subtsugae]MBW8288556.1 hypothetical protein [Chromobacterium subtsugae]WSE89834.1 hypothetical protein U6115_13150 [Chromobacterium subtsugae]WVH58205.1 hypothetical protein U6151_13170 [Chromobacterium subtsugae]